MELFGRDIFGGAQRREAVTATEAPADKVHGAKVPEQVVYVRGLRSALAIPAVQRAIMVRANHMSMMKPHLQRVMRSCGGCYEDATYGMAGDINYMLQKQPNGLQNATEFWKRVEYLRCGEGNAVVYVVRNGLRVMAAYVCHSASVNPITMDYTITYQSEHGMVSTVVPKSEVLHFKWDITSDDGLYGLSPAILSAEALGLVATNNRRAKSIAAKGGDMKYMVSEDTKSAQVGASRKLTQGQKDTQKSRIQDQLDEGDDVILVSGMMDVKPITDPTYIQSLQSMREADILEIARIYSVPPSSLFDLRNNTYKSPEQGTMELMQRAIAPAKVLYENELENMFIGRSGFGTMRVWMDDSYMYQMDPKSSAEIAKIRIETGVWCPNEARLVNNLPAIPHGDEHLVSTNLQKLSDIKVGKNQAAPAANDNDNQNEDGNED